MIKKFLKKITGTSGAKKTKRKNSKRKSIKKVITNQKFDNRFQKFYHLNKDRLNKERRGSYKSKSKKGICVRCSNKVVEGIVFCKYHQTKQKEYNAIARKRRKATKKKKR